jgi:hypothetical protein
VRDTIIGNKATIKTSRLNDSLIGDEAILIGANGAVSIGDHAEVRLTS